MATSASSTSTTNFAEQIPPAVYDAVCIGFYDLGVFFSPKFNNRSRKVRLAFELIGHEIPDKDGIMIPAVVGADFTLSLSDMAHLHKFIKAWRGIDFSAEELKDFDVPSMVGKPCMLTIIHQKSEDGTKTYANIGAIMGLKKGATIPVSINKHVVFDLDNFDQSIFDSIPEFVQKKIKESETWKSMFDANGNAIVIFTPATATATATATAVPVNAKLAQAKAALTPAQQATVKKVAPPDTFAIINGFNNVEELRAWGAASGYRDDKFVTAMRERIAEIEADAIAGINNDLPF
jgi:hypothetical protein